MAVVTVVTRVATANGANGVIIGHYPTVGERGGSTERQATYG